MSRIEGLNKQCNKQLSFHNKSRLYICSFSTAVSFVLVVQLPHMFLWDNIVNKLKCREIKLPSNCHPGRALPQFKLPHQRSVFEEPCQRHAAPMSPVCSSAIEDELRFTKNNLPLSIPPGVTTQVSPPAKLHWYLPLIIQLLSCKPQNLLQNQER